MCVCVTKEPSNNRAVEAATHVLLLKPLAKAVDTHLHSAFVSQVNFTDQFLAWRNSEIAGTLRSEVKSASVHCWVRAFGILAVDS